MGPDNSDTVTPILFLPTGRAGGMLAAMDVTPRKSDLDPDRPVPWFSCAFCRRTAEKPFRICESCGEEQPDRSPEAEA